MSAQFIVIYAGRGVSFDEKGGYVLGDHERATIFTNEADAWYAAYRANFSPHNVKVEAVS